MTEHYYTAEPVSGHDERRFTDPAEDAQRWVLVAKNRAIHQQND